MGTTEAAKNTGHSIGRCPTPIRLQYSQQYQLQWTSSCPVVHLRFIFRELGNGREGLFNRVIWVVAEVKDSFSLWVEYRSGYTFYSDHGLYNEGWGSVHGGKSHQRGSEEDGVLFLLCLFWAGGIGE